MNNKISSLIATFTIAISLLIPTLALGDSIPGIIFSKEKTENLALKLPIVGELTPPFWTPKTEEVLALEKILPEYIRKNTPKNRKPIHNIPKYKRQYFGITNNGKKQIYVNAFCEHYWSQTNDWQSKFVFVLGGGICYFQIRYDPAANELLNFVINSES